jgi:hypothetical protein
LTAPFANNVNQWVQGRQFSSRIRWLNVTVPDAAFVAARLLVKWFNVYFILPPVRMIRNSFIKVEPITYILSKRNMTNIIGSYSQYLQCMLNSCELHCTTTCRCQAMALELDQKGHITTEE